MLLYFKNNNINDHYILSEGVLQFYPSKIKHSHNTTAYNNLFDWFAIYLYDNRNYTSQIILYGAQLNSCVTQLVLGTSPQVM